MPKPRKTNAERVRAEKVTMTAIVPRGKTRDGKGGYIVPQATTRDTGYKTFREHWVKTTVMLPADLWEAAKD